MEKKTKLVIRLMALTALSLLAFCFVLSSCSKDEFNLAEPSEDEYTYGVAFSVGDSYDVEYTQQHAMAVHAVANQYNDIVKKAHEHYSSSFDENIINACDVFYKSQNAQDSEIIFTISIYKYVDSGKENVYNWMSTIKEYKYGYKTQK